MNRLTDTINRIRYITSFFRQMCVVMCC